VSTDGDVLIDGFENLIGTKPEIGFEDSDINTRVDRERPTDHSTSARVIMPAGTRRIGLHSLSYRQLEAPATAQVARAD